MQNRPLKTEKFNFIFRLEWEAKDMQLILVSLRDPQPAWWGKMGGYSGIDNSSFS